MTRLAARSCPEEASGELAGLRFLVAHKRRHLKARHPDPWAEHLGLLVYGHTPPAGVALPRACAAPGARPVAQSRQLCGPASDDPRPSMALIVVCDGELDAQLVFL